jgi:hypothetical protein
MNGKPSINGNGVGPLRQDLETDLYFQIREVERCLDRYPATLTDAVSKLLILVRRYNPELAWRPHLVTGDLVERMGEP